MRRAPGFTTYTGVSGETDEDVILCLKGTVDKGYQLEYAGFRNECKYQQFSVWKFMSIIRVKRGKHEENTGKAVIDRLAKPRNRRNWKLDKTEEFVRSWPRRKYWWRQWCDYGVPNIYTSIQDCRLVRHGYDCWYWAVVAAWVLSRGLSEQDT